MKKEIYAMFLPQFHRIPENDEWWGEGFTEWDNVRKAKPLYNNHLQPQVPLMGYYDLSDVKTLEMQTNLANKFGVDGFCFYHYYSNGKLLLEKPAENLLMTPSININYFFSWANHDWRRTWYQFNNELLFEQKYGDEKGIVEHYKYLSNFFKDKRYKKIDNKPLFVIYRSDLVENFELMKKIWNKCSIEDGFSGIYFVSTITGKGIDKNAMSYDAYYSFEPDAIISTKIGKTKRFVLEIRAKIIPVLNSKLKFHLFRQKFKYEYLCSKSYTPILGIDKPYIQGAFARWDNTPRHSFNGRVIIGSTKELFKKMIKEKISNSDPMALPIIIINSWNEWSEGSNIEPNTIDRYSFLEAIKEAVDE